MNLILNLKGIDYKMGANFGVKEANKYMHDMRNAAQRHIIDPNGVYYGREGNLRFAREFGYALNDFNKQGQDEILHGSYSAVYVICCNLKPILDAKEWIGILKSQIKTA